MAPTWAARVTVAGTATGGAAVTVSAVLVEAPDLGFVVTNAAGDAIDLAPDEPSPPEPLILTADPAGAFARSLTLAPGTWELTVVTDRSAPVMRTVVVDQPSGLRATISVDGADSYVELDEDGDAAEESGAIASDGDELTLQATTTLRIRVGNAGAVRITVNGIALGTMGDDGAVVEWRIRRAGG